MNTQFRIATAAIPICKKDGRRRYGIEAIGEIPAGTKFTYRPHDPKREFSAAFFNARIRGLGRVGTSVDEETAARIERLSKLADPGNFAELLATRDFPDEGFGGNVIDTLVAAGKVSMADVAAALDEYLAKEE